MRKGLGVLILGITFCFAGPANADVLLDQGTPAGAESAYSDLYDRVCNTDGDPCTPTTGFAAKKDQVIADDFTIRAGETWTLDGANVIGSYVLRGATGTGLPLPPPPPALLFVRIYADNGGQPGAPLYAPGAPLAATGGPNYTIPLPGGPTLSGGTYWISVQQTDALSYNNDFQFSQEWTWSLRPFSSGSPALMAGGNCEPWSSLLCEAENQPAAGSRASGGIDTRYGLSGFRTGSPLSCGGGVAGGGAKNFHPKIRKKDTVLGLRAVLKVTEPSDLAIEAEATLGGKRVDLGSHSLPNVKKAGKLRIPLPEPFRSKAQKGDKATLFLTVSIRPKTATGCTGGATKKLKVKTKVINVRANLLK